jgi:hypothetical protein
MAAEITDAFLARIENDLNERIEILTKSNQKYEQFLRYLSQISKVEVEMNEKISEEEMKDKGDNERKTMTISSGNIPPGSTSVPISTAYDDNDLNKILDRAKEIRSLNDKHKPKSNKKPENEKVNLMKMNENKKMRSVSAPRGSARGGATLATASSSSRNQREVLSKQKSEPSRVTSPIPPRLNHERNLEKKLVHKNEKSSLHFLITQSQILSNRNLQCPLISLFPTKPFLLSQFQFLTSLTGSPSFPPSLLEKVLQRMIPMKQQQSQQLPLRTYAKCLQTIRREYEKSTQSKLNRVHPTTLTEMEVANIFVWWHLLRRCIEVNENLRLKKFHEAMLENGHDDSPSSSSFSTQPMEALNSISSEEKRLHNLISQMVYEYPLSPLHSAPSSPPSQHYHAFESRVRYSVETMISRLLLKEVLQELKECCAEEVVKNRPSSARGSLSSSRKGSQMKWKHALQGLQSMETCLLEGANNTGATIFFEKDTK